MYIKGYTYLYQYIVMSSKAKKPAAKSAKGPKKARKAKAAPKAQQREDIPTAGLRRLLRRAGIARAVNPVYEELRKRLYEYVAVFVHDSVVVSQYDGRKTLMEVDIRAVSNMHGINLVAGVGDNVHETDGLKGRRGTTVHVAPAEEGATKKRHRTGVAAARDVRREQKNSDRLVFPHAGFLRVIKEIAHTDVRVSESFALLLQLSTEDYLVKLLQSAKQIIDVENKKTLFLKYVQLVYDISQHVIAAPSS